MSRAAVLATRSNSNGRFQLESLPSGRATLAAMKSGFISTFYGQGSAATGPIGWLLLPDGGTVVQASFRLSRGASIHGRITDRAGVSVVNAVVTAFPTDDEDGRNRELLAIQNASGIARPFENHHVRTDDRGAFRIGALAPGEYYLLAAPISGVESTWTLPIYFPGTPDRERATVVKLSPGREVEASFVVGPVHRIFVSGIVTTASGNRAHEGVVKAIRRSPDRELITSTTIVGGIEAEGRFRIAVPAGRYTLLAVSGNPWKSTGVQQDVETARVAISAADFDIHDVVLATSPGFTVNGRVVTSSGTVPQGAQDLRVAAVPLQGVSSVIGSATVQG
jgi:hypothetical protein